MINTIHTHMTEDELELLRKFSKKSNVKVALEIGSYLGASSVAIASGLNGKNGARLYCIDTWKNDGMSEGSRDTFQEFFTNTLNLHGYIFPLRGWSTSFLPLLKEAGVKLDLVFIDGAHDYESVKNDFEGVKPLLKKGSYIFMHDIGWAEGVVKVINEDVLLISKEKQKMPNLWFGEVY